MNTLFVAWQDPNQRAWYPVGRLSFNDNRYQFVYTRGANQAKQKANFQYLPKFDNLDDIYESEDLFPLFSNRLPPRSRPDYNEFVHYLNLSADSNDLIEMLAISGGRRVTDALELFAYPELSENGFYELHFFVHGLRHFPEEVHKKVEKLAVGDRLLLLLDFQNQYDNYALALRTNGSSSGRYLIGYVPRYLLPEAYKIIQNPDNFVNITVEKMNPSPAPLQVRLLCKLSTRLSGNFHPFDSDEYQPIPEIS